MKIEALLHAICTAQHLSRKEPMALMCRLHTRNPARAAQSGVITRGMWLAFHKRNPGALSRSISSDLQAMATAFDLAAAMAAVDSIVPAKNVAK